VGAYTDHDALKYLLTKKKMLSLGWSDKFAYSKNLT
jgi:hypothetical protein